MKPLEHWIADLFSHEDLLKMGHGQSAEDLNLGLGWLYYALVRMQKCANIVVIGSYRGYVPMVLARAQRDNGNGGRVHFIDPSFVDDFWKDADKVREHFNSFELDNITHHRYTTQEFVHTEDFNVIDGVDLLFVDGYHTAEQARFDYEAFETKLSTGAIVLFHDSIERRPSQRYGKDRIYAHSVVDYMDELKQNKGLQVLDFPISSGVTLLRKL